MKKLLFTLLAVTSLAATSQAELITVLTSSNRLITIESSDPGTAISNLAVTGLASGESLAGIDYRPATGELFGLGNTSRLYSIDANTGVATAIGAPNLFTLVGTSFGFDFNPTVDRIRVTSSSDGNLRLNPNDGTLSATDGLLVYAAGDPNQGTNANITGSAYSNNFPGAGATALYDIDSNLDILALQEPPNDGTLLTLGPLGVDAGDQVGFDISPQTGIAYASLDVGGATNLYVINLRTGAATLPTGATDPATIAPAARGADTVVDIAAVANPGSRLRNVATRGRVGQGENILIGGFITRGSGPGASGRYIIRGIGPSLSSSGVVDPLADPVLTLFDSNMAPLQTNDDFSASADAAAITAAGFAPANGQESVILVTLPPGSYTAHVTGKGNDTGVAVVEVYELP